MQEQEDNNLIAAPFEVRNSDITENVIERQFSRTFTEIETEDLKQKRKEMRQT